MGVGLEHLVARPFAVGAFFMALTGMLIAELAGFPVIPRGIGQFMAVMQTSVAPQMQGHVAFR